MQSRIHSYTDDPIEGPAAKADDTVQNWSVARQSSLRTTYRYHETINDIQVLIHVSTPQDGTWMVTSTIEVDPRGRGFLPTIARDYETRPAAELAAVKLITGLNSETMLRQFIVGQSNLHEGDLSTVDAIRHALVQKP